jgi:hypothetical protein
LGHLFKIEVKSKKVKVKSKKEKSTATTATPIGKQHFTVAAANSASALHNDGTLTLPSPVKGEG